MIYLVEQVVFNIANKYHKEKRMINEKLTGCPMTAGAEGVVKFAGKYWWCKFSTPELYNITSRTWVGDRLPEMNTVISDFRTSVENRVPKNDRPEFTGLSSAIQRHMRDLNCEKSTSISEDSKSPENSGLSCNYYVVDIKQPTSLGKQYTAECNDIIEALGMNAQEANIFKEIWRTSAARTLGKEKAGHNAKRGAEKVAFFGLRYALQNGVSHVDMMKTLQDMKVDV